MAKYIQRPIVRVKYEAPSREGARCYNEEKRAFKALLKSFPSTKVERELLKVEERLVSQKLELEQIFKRLSVLRASVVPSKTYAQSVKPTAVSTGIVVYTRRPDPPDLTRAAARRDYSRAYDKMVSERAQARALVVAMANRRPIRASRVLASKSLVRSKDLVEAVRALRREKRYLSRHPAKEVEVFPLSGEVVDSFEEVTVQVQQHLPGVVRATSVKQVKKRSNRYFTSERWVDKQTYRIRDTSSRLGLEEINFLKFKLRLCIMRFRELDRLEAWIRRLVNPEIVTGQMDTAGEVQGSVVDEDQKANTTILSSTKLEVGKAPVTLPGFKDLAVSQEKQTFNTMTDKWVRLGTHTWSTTQSANDLIFSYQLPYDIMQNLKDSQMAQLMFTNRLFRADLKVKLVVNSSPWMVGMAICDWQYGHNGSNDGIRNIWSAVQRNHVRLSAGSSNNAELKIPFATTSSFIRTMPYYSQMGRLSCRVFNPLSVIDKVASQVNISVFVALENFEGHALVSRNIGLQDLTLKGQMNTIGDLCNVGSNVLRTAGNIFNQDKPPLPLQPNSLVPQTVCSFSYTDGITEPINVLRSDPRGQRPPSMIAKDMALQSFTRTWGYLDTFEWSFNSKEDLWSTPVKPLLSHGSYVSVETVGNINYVVLPPVAFISTMASKVRGNMEYMFEVIANSFYTGTLQISCVPLDDKQKRTKDEAIMSATQIMDIQKTSKFVISVPWNWINAWMKTRTLQTSLSDSLARLYVKVMNPLIAIANVPSSIYINVYVRGGVNFEISQLRTPVIGLKNKVILPNGEILKPYNFEDKWYISTSKRAVGTKDYLRVPVIQNVVDGWVGYTNIILNSVYKLERTTKYKFFKVGPYQTDNTNMGLFGVGTPDLRTSNAQGLALFSTEQAAREFVTQCGPLYTPEKIQAYLDTHGAEKWTADTDWSQVGYIKKVNNSSAIEWVYATNEEGDYPIWRELPAAREDFEIIGQMEEAPYVIETEVLAPGTNFGTRTYGESMPDVKGIARRWQTYSSFTGVTCTERSLKECPPLFAFSVAPQRPVVPRISHDYDNRVRDGSISLFNSCFAFWEGGMRYRFIVVNEIPEDAILYIQHRFDYNTSFFLPPFNKAARSANDLMDPHYPTFVQALSINPVATVEVPYMRMEEKLRNDATDSSWNNGIIMVWVHSPKQVSIDIDVYYSVADDFQWSIFQGTPAIMNLRDIVDEPTGQMNEQGIPYTEDFLSQECEAKLEKRPHLARYFSDDEDQPEEVTGQIFGIVGRVRDGVVSAASAGITAGAKSVTEKAMESAERPKDLFETTVKQVGDAVTSSSQQIKDIAQTFEKVSKKLEGFVDNVQNVPAQLSTSQKERLLNEGSAGLLSDMGSAAFDYLTHLMYCAINPNGPTVAWAVVNLYRTVWGFTFDGISKIVTPIGNLWTKAVQATQQPQPVGNMEDTDLSSICSILFCSMSTMLKLVVKPPTSWARICDGLFDFSCAARGANVIGVFIKDNIRLLKRIWYKILSVFSIASPQYKLIAGIQDDRLKQWCVYSTAILNPSIREQVYTHPLWAEKVFELAITGRAFVVTMMNDKTIPVGLSKIVHDNLTALRKFEQELVNRKVFCGERYEPFCIWACGPAGSGKSRAMQTVATGLADMMEIPCATTYHTITMNQKYFDGYTGQPTIFIDDFFAMDATTDPTVPMFCQMKSSALFNPPYSETKEKSKLVNFYNLIITSNYESARNRAGIHDYTAYDRRRDLLLRFKPMAKSLDANNKEIPWTLEDYEKCRHFRVQWAADPVKMDIWVDLEAIDHEEYSETFQRFIKERAKAYHDIESKSFKDRCQLKISRLDKFSNAATVDQYLNDVEKLLIADVNNDPTKKIGLCDLWRKPFEVKEGEAPDDVLASMLASEDSQADCSFIQPDLTTPQMDTKPSTSKEAVAQNLENLRAIAGKTAASDIADGKKWDRITTFWPLVGMNDGEEDATSLYKDLFEGDVLEPLQRLTPRATKTRCLHECVQDPAAYSYNKKSGYYYLTVGYSLTPEEVPFSFSPGTCYHVEGGKIEPMRDCIMHDRFKRTEFVSKFFQFWIQCNPEYSVDWVSGGMHRVCADETIDDIPPEYLTVMMDVAQKVKEPMKLMQINKRLRQKVNDMQRKIQEKHVTFDNITLPKESKWTSVPKAIWRGLVKVCSWIERVFCGLLAIVATFSSIASLVFFGGLAYTAYNTTKGNLHPSGDFKTIRNSSNMRTKASIIAQHNSSGEVADETILKFCSDKYVDPSSDGRLRHLINNTFTLTGIAPQGKDSMMYKVRCIGLHKYSFICLKHYIDHFKAMGVEDVVIVYHKTKGMQTFKLSDVQFKWTKNGYGIGTFPTLGRMFKDITYLMPSENFDGNYPASMSLVEVSVDDVIIREMKVERLMGIKHVPQNKEQTAWDIENGFTYKWGGSGKCGTILFCPTMQCPFVGIHTAGIGQKIGFGELLLKETFVPKESLFIDFVQPQMNDTGKLDMPGQGYIVGELDANKSVHGPTETRILPSVIHGVFPVKTAPAPLKRNDPRLPPYTDPLVAGIEKRCDPPSEFPTKFLEMAATDLEFRLIASVKPQRHVSPLSYKESVEGLTLPGYDALEMSTSEGYPWTLMRPVDAHNKSWLFNTDRYVDGRLKLEGIHKKLYDMLELKHRMREKGVVPATYYTACLKDARLSLDKISTPGKTRVFEMSPVDLTIAQRQYFLDFYVAYSDTRTDIENTIGINPEGVEWSLLAKKLKEFSPYILTADYSGYGPRLLMSVQKKVYEAQIAWYYHHERKYDEKKALDNKRVRTTMMFEMLHPLTVVRDGVYLFPTGMPSGNAGTVIINSLCNSIYIRVIYLVLATQHAPQYADMYWFKKFVMMMSNGDDLIISVKPDIISWFNNSTMIAAFSNFKIKMTDALKSGKESEWCEINEATYLKRGFVPHPFRDGEWLAPLEEASITDTANWIWKSVNNIDASLVNSEMSCRLAYSSGEVYYNRIAETLRQRWLEEGVQFEYPSWKSLDMHVWEQTQGPLFQVHL